MIAAAPIWQGADVGVVKIGNAHGLIAIYCDETEALDLAELFPYPDTFGLEIRQAVEKAYPKPEPDEASS